MLFQLLLLLAKLFSARSLIGIVREFGRNANGVITLLHAITFVVMLGLLAYFILAPQ